MIWQLLDIINHRITFGTWGKFRNWLCEKSTKSEKKKEWW